MRSHSVTCHPTEVRESRLNTQLKRVLDLATPKECKAELTYVTWKRTGWELNRRPVNCKSNALPLSHHAAQVLTRSWLPQLLALDVDWIVCLAVHVKPHLWWRQCQSPGRCDMQTAVTSAVLKQKCTKTKLNYTKVNSLKRLVLQVAIQSSTTKLQEWCFLTPTRT